ncbi:hypothetical protein CRYUN_Cryun04dG0049900 [Craigia yunnanensis]
MAADSASIATASSSVTEDELTLTVKRSGKDYTIRVCGDDSVVELKRRIHQLETPEIIDDFELGQDEAVDIKYKEVNKQKLKRRIDQYKIELKVRAVKERNCLFWILTILYLITGPQQRIHFNSCGLVSLLLLYLHEFLTAAYAEYDIMIWSATSSFLGIWVSALCM